jgi:hypothetical protein
VGGNAISSAWVIGEWPDQGAVDGVEWSGVEWGSAGSGQWTGDVTSGSRSASKRGEQRAADASAGQIHMFVFMF